MVKIYFATDTYQTSTAPMQGDQDMVEEPLCTVTFSRVIPSRLSSSVSQFEETIGHRRDRRRGDGKTLVHGFQDKTAVEAPGESAAVAVRMDLPQAR
jgi:hypothetical protein